MSKKNGIYRFEFAGVKCEGLFANDNLIKLYADKYGKGEELNPNSIDLRGLIFKKIR